MHGGILEPPMFGNILQMKNKWLITEEDTEKYLEHESVRIYNIIMAFLIKVGKKIKPDADENNCSEHHL